MDGYAVRAADVAGASAQSPSVLRLAGCSPAGDHLPVPVEAGTCTRVFTGAPLPPGADAVVMQEDTRASTTVPGQIEVLDAVKPWENVRFQGEDVKKGQAVTAPGGRLTAARIALASALGIVSAEVCRRPRVAVIATGSELVEAGGPLGPGKIYESNRTMLAPLVERAGGIPRVFPLVRDTLEATRDALAAAGNECDAVITSGGVSVGELDYVKAALEQLGGTLGFWRVGMKPGKPFVFGHWNGRYLFGLPGNPVSAMVTFLLLVRPALLRLQGATRTGPARYWVAAGEPIANRGDRRHFARARLDGDGRAWLAGPQASHLLGSLADADGLIDLPAGASLVPGDRVAFLPIED